MAFKDDLNSDMATFFNLDEFAEEIAYLAQGQQNQVNVPAIIDFGPDLDEIRGQKAEVASVQVRKSDLPVITPGDKLWIDSVQWLVRRVESADEHTAIITAYKDERART